MSLSDIYCVDDLLKAWKEEIRSLGVKLPMQLQQVLVLSFGIPDCCCHSNLIQKLSTD